MSKPQKIAITWLPTEQLIPYANNSKMHTVEQVDQIAASIKAFGFNDPIAVDEENVVIAGHGRLLAAQKLGLQKVPVINLEHLTPAEKKAYMLAHNKLTLNTGWDSEKLSVEFETLKELDYQDWSVTGFSTDDISHLFQNNSSLLGESDTANEREISINYQSQYGVIVMCESEDQQEQIYSDLSESGYNCKVVVT